MGRMRATLSAHARVEAGKELADLAVVLGLVNHLAQPSDIKSPPLVTVLDHVVEVIERAVWALVDTVSVGLDRGSAARSCVPVAPSLKGEATATVRRAVSLLLWLARANLDGAPTDGNAQGGEGALGGVAVGEVDEAVARVARTDRIDRDVNLVEVAEAVGGQRLLDVVGLD